MLDSIIIIIISSILVALIGAGIYLSVTMFGFLLSIPVIAMGIFAMSQYILLILGTIGVI